MQGRLFHALLRLLPRELRADFGGEMERVFRDELREARASGRGAVIRLWLGTLADLMWTARGEHLDVLRRDLRFAVRSLARRPIHTAVALTSLALALAAQVAVFAVVDAVLLRPLPFRDPEALVAVAETGRQGDASNLGFLTYVDLRSRSHSFERLEATTLSTATLVDAGLSPERVNALRVSHGYFEMLGVEPALGRSFSPAEDRPGAARRVAVLTDSLWRSRYGADPGVVGRPLDVAGTAYVVVGVLPAGFEDLIAERGYDGARVYFPLGYDAAASYACRTCRHVGVYGRLTPGVTPATAERELRSLLVDLEREHPTEYAGAGARVTTLRDLFLGPVRPLLLVLWAGVACLLLVAGAHVVNLLLLRASEREREIAVRLALGVSRPRLARLLLTEAVLLAGAGGAAGTALAALAVRTLAAAGPERLPRLQHASVNAAALGVACALTLACALLFCLVSLRQVLAGATVGTLHGAGRPSTSRASWRLRTGLVAANVAIALLLLVGSGLLVRSLRGLLAVAPGFDPEGVVTLRVWLSGPRYASDSNEGEIDAASGFYEEVLERARALPGVTAASAVTTLPLGGGVDAYGLHVVGRPLANPEDAPSADRFVVATQAFEAFGLPLLRGRALERRDRREAERVVVVNERLAESVFRGEEALGQQIALGGPDAPRRTIVGIAADVRHHGLDTPPGYQVWVPQAQWAWAETGMTLVVRSQADPAALAGALRGIVRDLDREQPVTDVRLYADIVGSATAERRLAAGLVSGFAATALLLSLVGLYGAVAIYVGQRRHEIGLRIALGADAAAIALLVARHGLRPVALGLPVGLALAALGSRALLSLLFEVGPLDPTAYASAALIVAAGGAAACVAPAWRAARVPPRETLGAE